MISLEVLRRYPYFAKVSEESLKKVAMAADEFIVPAGATLFTEGDPADKLYILLDGELDIQYTLGSGEKKTVDTLVSGELMLWSALVEPFRSTESGKLRKDSRLVAIDGKKLRELCEQDHSLGFRMMNSVAQLLATRLEGARVQLATV